MVSRGFIFLGFGLLGIGGSFAMGAGAWYFASHGRGEMLALLALAGIFVLATFSGDGQRVHGKCGFVEPAAVPPFVFLLIF